MMMRRGFIGALAVLLAVGLLVVLPGGGLAQQKVAKIGMSFPLTGADADSADSITKGAQLAIDEINGKGGVAGYKLESIIFDSATPAAGQYDPAQAATNIRKFIADAAVVALIGPQMSGEGKATSPILSEADLATITPSSTNPDITDPKFQAQYRPKGKAVYFRTVTTDAYQGPNMANHAFHNLKVKKVYILDDSGAFGVGIADSFERRAKELKIEVLGRDRLDPKEADYKTVLTKIKGLNPDAIYYGGVQQAAVKLARQLQEVMPKIHKLGSDGIYDLAFPEQSSKEAAEWINAYKSKFKREPTNYSITAYNAVKVIADSIDRTVKANKPVNRTNIRDAIQSASLKGTLQGDIAFDANGDILSKVVSLYQVDKDGKFVYKGVAPEK